MAWFLILVLVAVATWFLTSSKKSRPLERRQPVPEPPTVTVEFRTSTSSADTTRGMTFDKDAWEGWFINEAADPKPVSARLRLKYVDGNGTATERTVQVREFDNAPNKSGLIMGLCELRNANRTFRYDRIRECVDLATGEVVSDTQAHLRAIYVGSPDHSLEKFTEGYADPLECLLFVARADGRIMAAERAVIVDFCRKLLPDTRVTDDSMAGLLKGARTISIHTFRQVVGRVAKLDATVRADIVTAAAAIVGTQKTVHPAEKEAVDYLRKRLGDPASAGPAQTAAAPRDGVG